MQSVNSHLWLMQLFTVAPTISDIGGMSATAYGWGIGDFRFLICPLLVISR